MDYARCVLAVVFWASTPLAQVEVLRRRCKGSLASVYATTLEYDLNFSIGRCCRVECGARYLERFILANYAAGPLGIFVAYFILRVVVSLDRVVMTLFPNTSLTDTARESVAARALGSK